jgi:hypothetical protein
MSIKGKSALLAVGALGLILAGAGPALAQHSGGGGGHASGGHSMGGGHAAVGHAGGGAHFAGPGHFAGGAHVATAYHGGAYARGGYVGHAGYAGGHGYSTGYRGGYGYGGWRGSAWRGGYWHGGFWPGAFYGPGFAWFLPILPLAYATYWYSGIPYYYANDVYYTWNPTYDGYVATDPPPVADSSSGSADVGAPPASGADYQSSGPAPAAGPGPGGPVPGQIFMYPKNGQSTEQQASDRAECQKWATDQAGQVAQNGSDYNRAMVACVEGRGYSAR